MRGPVGHRPGDGGRGKGSGAGDEMPGKRKKNTEGKEQDERKRKRWGGKMKVGLFVHSWISSNIFIMGRTRT